MATEIPMPEEELENSLVEQVALTVPITDDPTLPVVTFRMWVLGSVSCVILSFLNQFFWYRTNPLGIRSTSAVIASLPLGRLMAKTITDRVFFKGTRWAFTLNPGPFNIKDHVLISILAGSGSGTVYATHILSSVKLYYKRELTFFVALILMMTTQVLGLGLAGIFQRYLIEPAEMWWPTNLVSVSLYRPWVCWVFPKSVLAHQLGSGIDGLGIGAISLDWNVVTAYLGSPLASPWHATANVACGYIFFAYVVVPIAYWCNMYDAKTFPIISKELFTSSGKLYDVETIVNSNFNLDLKSYISKGPLYLSTLFAMTSGLGFATFTATLVHIGLSNGRKIWEQYKSGMENKKMDVHTKLMQKYKKVPQWWFIAILVVKFILVMVAILFYQRQVQLPWWGLAFAFLLALIFTLPIGIIYATTAQPPGLNILTEYVMGYIYPGRPVANMCFTVYGYISMVQALSFLEDIKLAHYMKIPPRSMFMAQVVGTVLSTFVYTVTAWWIMETVPNVCDTSVLPPNSAWQCPYDKVFYDASVIWGLIGPRRIFGNLGTYNAINWFFALGAIAPFIVWLLHKFFPRQKWILLINTPVIFGAAGLMPPASTINYTSWLVLAFISGFVVFKYKKDMWKKYNYVLSAGLDTGIGFYGVLSFIALGTIQIDWWGTYVDGCPLATCPTAKGVVVDGCPVV